MANLDEVPDAFRTLAMTRPRVLHFHTDQIGTPQEVTGQDGTLLWSGRYDAWGRVRKGDVTARIEQPLRFAGQYADGSTGLHYNTFRYYDPDVGRFVSQDPIGLAGGENLYGYGANPVSWSDPLGWAPHTATISVYAPDGTLRYSEPLTSGGATGSSWPEQIASHTESKSIIDPRIQAGDHVVYTDASLEPCRGCRGNMNNVAANKGVTVEYHWTDATGANGSWNTDPRMAGRTIRAREQARARAAAKGGGSSC